MYWFEKRARAGRAGGAAIAIIGLMTVSPAIAEITGVTARVSSGVVEFEGGVELQSDFATFEFPSPSAALPLSAETRLVSEADDGSTEAAARGITVFNNDGSGGTPSDFSLELAAFSGEGRKSWTARAEAVETRGIVLTAADIGGLPGQGVQVESLFFLSGALILTAPDAAMDLSGSVVEMSFRIIHEPGDGGQEIVVLEGGASLFGGPNGEVGRDTSGAINGAFHNVVSLDANVAELPLFRALIFNAVLPFDQYPYQYSAVAGEEFKLRLEFNCRLTTLPEVGAAAVFGRAQEAFGDVFSRVKSSEAGFDAQRAVAELVDTTGQDIPAGQTVLTPLPIISLCGTVGFEGVALFAAGGAWMALARMRGRRRRRARIPRPAT